MGRKAREERVLGTNGKPHYMVSVSDSQLYVRSCVCVSASLFLLSLARNYGPIGAGDFGQPIGVRFSLYRSGKFRSGSEIDKFPDKRWLDLFLLATRITQARKESTERRWSRIGSGRP